MTLYSDTNCQNALRISQINYGKKIQRMFPLKIVVDFLEVKCSVRS